MPKIPLREELPSRGLGSARGNDSASETSLPKSQDPDGTAMDGPTYREQDKHNAYLALGCLALALVILVITVSLNGC
jgi:hypothetical protein